MDQIVFVVRQDRRELYDALRRVLGDEEHVAVVLDRRTRARREREAGYAPERRWADRRVRAKVAEEIQQRGWSVARVSP